MYDIIIIGAGVSGCACARELSRYDAKILVVEKEEDVCCGTSKANSAIVHAGYDAAHGSLMAKLNVEGSRRMPALAKELDFAYERCGSLVVCLSDEDRPALQKLYENGIANGVEGLRIIERDELVGMEPNISDAAVAALWAPTGGIVCPFGLTFALAENAAKNGVQFRFDTKVTGLHPLDGGGSGWAVETDHGTLETRCIVNAAGVYADTLHNMADAAHPMTITARRGDYFLLDHTAGQHVRHTVFQLPGKYGKGVLVTPTVHGNLLVGPTAIDVDDKEATATTAAGLDEVRENPASRSRTFRCARPSRASRVCAPTRRDTTSSSARSRPALWTARPSSRPACPAPRPSVRWSRTSCAAVCTYTISPILTRRAGAFWTPKRWILQRGRSLSDKTRPTGRLYAGARA